MKKLRIYQEIIRSGKADQAYLLNDSEFKELLIKHETEAGPIEIDLNEIDENFGKLARNRNEIKRYIDKVSEALHNFTSEQIH